MNSPISGDAKGLPRRLGAALGAMGISGISSGLLAAAWPSPIGVILSASERGVVAGAVGLAGGALGLAAALLGAPWSAALLGPALLCWVAALPVREGLHPVVGEAGVVGILALGLLAVRLGRGRRGLPIAVGLVLVLGLCRWPVPPSRPSVSPGSPDLLLITLDTVRADMFAWSGGDLPPAFTPHLDAFARQSRVFTAVMSPIALTLPAHVSLLSGLPPRIHGVIRNGVPLPDDLPWLPAVLSEAGYRTQAFVSAAVLEGDLGLSRGFERYESTFSDRLARGSPFLGLRGWRRREGSTFHRAGAETLDRLFADGLPEGGPRFTWVHLYDAHWPYTPSAAAAARVGLADPTPLGDPLLPMSLAMGGQTPDAETVARGAALYRAGIEDLDALVGRLLERVDPGTVVLLVGDHGESLGEHGSTFNHGFTATTPDTWVPLLLRAPGVEPGVEASPVSTCAVAPTLLSLLEIPLPEGMSGPTLFESAGAGVSEAWLGRGEERGLEGVALREGRRSVVRQGEVVEGFDLERDPRELHGAPVEEGDPLVERARGIRGRVAGEGLSEGRREALRALGYVE